MASSSGPFARTVTIGYLALTWTLSYLVLGSACAFLTLLVAVFLGACSHLLERVITRRSVHPR